MMGRLQFGNVGRGAGSRPVLNEVKDLSFFVTDPSKLRMREAHFELDQEARGARGKVTVKVVPTLGALVTEI
jgi:hypothetical protein